MRGAIGFALMPEDADKVGRAHSEASHINGIVEKDLSLCLLV
jgi:hypothetical protein